ncbi:quinone oxidoreductase [Mycobacterium cookii]|uniref:Quinone oxidoreductase n=1 Tax=Mycobacterium cookii TaxID=1775 RepID=A0A7I7L3R8_9MYCO|nr:quinone oxidoreductase [Mycobacterium cookii]MCV7328936.1 quinone oxidoreductase [Mycobacterium cookii]BBX48398.1 quinone oxidoreductase [Mycobacterium cookii]
MRVIEVSALGGPEVLDYVERPVPEPGPGQVLIKAEAIGVNFIDTYFRTGLYPRPLPFILGSEVCGTVVGVGAEVGRLSVGDRVATSDALGAYAEFTVAPADLVTPVPGGVAPEVAASALLKGHTAHLLIRSVYPVGADVTVLLHAGAGGVGLILTQWATSLGARVITTVSTPQKAELSRQAGAVEVLDYPNDPAVFGAAIRSLTDGEGVAAAYDGVGKSTFDASLASLAIRGTLALYGASSGPVPPVDPQRLNAAGSVYLTRPMRTHFNRTYDEFAWRSADLFQVILDGTVTVTTGKTYRLADAAQAHRDLEGRKTHGSTVLIP